jgi:hypothetical protein
MDEMIAQGLEKAAPPSLGSRMQLGIVVPDLEAALTYWTCRLKVGPFVLIEDPVGDAVFSHRGQSSSVKMSVAFSYVGDTMVELLMRWRRLNLT